MKKKGLILSLLLILLMPLTINAVDMAKYFPGGYKDNGVKGTLSDSVKILNKCSSTRVEDDAPLVPLEDCYVTLYLEDDVDTPDKVAEFVEIINMTDGYFHEFRHTTLKRVEGVNNWTYQENDGKYTITPPNGEKYKLKKGERVEVLKFTLAIDNQPYEDGCGAKFDMTINQEVPKCQIVDGQYFDKEGNLVDEEKYKEDCTPKCEFKDDKYYDPDGNIVDKDTYDEKCNPKCEIKDDKYYDPNGHEVDKDTYDKMCGPKCEIKEDKYYDKDGHEVDKDTYDRECNPKCRVEGDKYYDDEGHEVTKEEWDAKCKVVENPQTGLLVPLIILGSGGIVGGIIYFITYRRKIYKL